MKKCMKNSAFVYTFVTLSLSLNVPFIHSKENNYTLNKMSMEMYLDSESLESCKQTRENINWKGSVDGVEIYPQKKYEEKYKVEMPDNSEDIEYFPVKVQERFNIEIKSERLNKALIGVYSRNDLQWQSSNKPLHVSISHESVPGSKTFNLSYLFLLDELKINHNSGTLIEYKKKDSNIISVPKWYRNNKEIDRPFYFVFYIGDKKIADTQDSLLPTGSASHDKESLVKMIKEANRVSIAVVDKTGLLGQKDSEVHRFFYSSESLLDILMQTNSAAANAPFLFENNRCRPSFNIFG